LCRLGHHLSGLSEAESADPVLPAGLLARLLARPPAALPWLVSLPLPLLAAVLLPLFCKAREVTAAGEGEGVTPAGAAMAVAAAGV